VTDAGIGHLVMEMMVSLSITLENPNTTFVYEPVDQWGDIQAHGPVKWAEDFFR
jgi:hypothetical protein